MKFGNTSHNCSLKHNNGFLNYNSFGVWKVPYHTIIPPYQPRFRLRNGIIRNTNGCRILNRESFTATAKLFCQSLRFMFAGGRFLNLLCSLFSCCLHSPSVTHCYNKCRHMTITYFATLQRS